MRVTLAVTIGVVGALTLGACGERPAGPKPAEAAPAGNAPILVSEYNAGMPGDPDSRSSGVRLAVWDDGTVLMGMDPLHPDKDMRVGTLTPEQLKSAMAGLDKAGFFARPDYTYLVPDSSSVRVRAAWNGRVRTHSIVSYAQKQETWWRDVEGALAAFRPEQTRSVTEAATNGEFRGFIVKEWWSTKWRPG